MSNTLSTSLEQSRENEKLASFLQLLKTNPDHITSPAIKAEYLELLDVAFKQAKKDLKWARYVLPELLKVGILGQEDKEKYLEFLEFSFKQAKKDLEWAEYVVPELLKVGILGQEDKERYFELLSVAFKQAKKDLEWARYVLPELLKVGILGQEDKERYFELLSVAFEQAKKDLKWARYVLPELLKVGILGQEDKERYFELLSVAFEQAKKDLEWARYVLPELLKVGILGQEDKERYFELLSVAFEQAKKDLEWAEYVVPELLKVGILGQEDKEKYLEFLEFSFKQAKKDSDSSLYVISKLLKLGIIGQEDKEHYIRFLNIAIEEAKKDSDWALYVVPKLLELGIVGDEETKGMCLEFLSVAFEQAKKDSEWTRYVLPELLKVGILGQEELKGVFLVFLDYVFEQAKENSFYAAEVLPRLLKLGIVEQEEVKERYLELLNVAFENAKEARKWAEYVVPILLKLGIVGKEEVKEKYLEFWGFVFERARAGGYWAEKIVPVLLQLGTVGEEDKKKYFEFLEFAFERAREGGYWTKTGLPALLQVGILEKKDRLIYLEFLDMAFKRAKTDIDWSEKILPQLLQWDLLDKSTHEQFSGKKSTYRLYETVFLTKYSNQISAQDLIAFGQLDTILTQEEKRFLCTQSYDDFVTFQERVERKDYKPLRNIKQRFYPKEEQEKLQNLIAYFGDEVWIYFFDKVHTEKELKNRFRDPHNALLHTDKIIQLAQELEKKGVSKADFIKHYLGVAGDRNHGYQQLNDFLVKYAFDWHEQMLAIMDTSELKDNLDFMLSAQRVLELERSGELYKNLDRLEQILPVLNMIRNKESLLKLQKLAISEDPKDEIRYQYFKNAIYHPRTKPLIMDMYERPQSFLGLDDTTSRDINRLHQAKKPSNMVENFPYLDFSAEDLVNCLPLGIYDKLSYFKPYEKQYLVNGSSVYTLQEVKNQLSDFLSSSDQKRMSTIITKYNALFADTPLSFKAWKENPQSFVDKLLADSDFTLWIELFTQLGYQEFNKYKNLRLMTAKISPKADPNNRFNGFNCDSLAEGHGKKVVAMFNPYCTDFCVYEGEPDPKIDNLKVTSRVTLNRAIPHNFNSLLEKAKTSTTYDIAKLFGKDFEDYKDPKEYVITMDNIEADANFGNKHAMTIRKIYEDFFSDYIRQHPLSPNGVPLNTSKFYSGKSYNKIDILEKSEENQTLPVFVNAYTDNADSQSLVGELNAGPQVEKVKKTGIHPLSIEDVVQISYLEGKVYPEGLKSHLGNMQHEITASILNNTLKSRQNISFTRYDETGKLRGYLLAYQGKMEDGRTGIYLSDFVIDEQARGRSGLAMIFHWIQQIKKHYPEMPVFTKARASTSYRMLIALVEKYGYQITEDQRVRYGGEDFHFITMEAKKS